MPIFALDWRLGHPTSSLSSMCELQSRSRIQPCPYSAWGKAFPPWAHLLYPFQKGKRVRDGLLPLTFITSSLLMFLFSLLAQACSADISYHFFQIVRWTRTNPVLLTHVSLDRLLIVFQAWWRACIPKIWTVFSSVLLCLIQDTASSWNLTTLPGWGTISFP